MTSMTQRKHDLDVDSNQVVGADGADETRVPPELHGNRYAVLFDSA